ncbi:hypothetical protein [Rhizobium sp. NFR03]|uniref:hypothetical protein n=1 Tax=Rhizobium sp. NFR03 TaxID=1566263 RepID=UPI0008B673D8|nr:hypothetical protein [Rhizobium sp. NFR03]SES42671.1 hypothetical protein SAMN03159406_04302 [Rhizobium sp. NFR03]
MTVRFKSRYRPRLDRDNSWAVEDIHTGETAAITGVAQDGMDLPTAEYLAEVLNRDHRHRQTKTSH